MPAGNPPRFRVYVPVPAGTWSRADWDRVLAALPGINVEALAAVATQQADSSIVQNITKAHGDYMGAQCSQLQHEPS